MGLDQYLYASRRFDADSDSARAILDAAEMSLEQLQKHAEVDPREDEPTIYLSRWEFDNPEGQGAFCLRRGSGGSS